MGAFGVQIQNRLPSEGHLCWGAGLYRCPQDGVQSSPEECIPRAVSTEPAGHLSRGCKSLHTLGGFGGVGEGHSGSRAHPSAALVTS